VTRRSLFRLHGWLGLNFGLLLALVCLSGVAATLAPEIEWLSQPELRVEADRPVQWEATYRSIRQAYPDHRLATLSKLPDSVLDSAAWQAQIFAPEGAWRMLRVDPYTGKILRAPSRLYLNDYIRQLHYTFFSNWGFYLVCFVALPLFLSLTSALLFYRRWWRSLFWVSLTKGARSFVSSLHRFLGVWSAVFGGIVALTGLWYLAEAELVAYETAYPPKPSLSSEQMAAHGPTPERLSLDAYVAAAKEAFPGLAPTGINLPSSANGTVMVEGSTGAPLQRPRANAVFLDPYDGAVVEVRRSREAGALSWWVDAADALHFGYWGGLTSKILWAVFGLALPVLVLSGAYLSWRRGRAIEAQSATTSATRANPASAGRLPPLRSWLVLPVLAGLAGMSIQGYAARQPVAAPKTTIGETAIGPWHVAVRRQRTVEPGECARYYLRFYGGGETTTASFKSARITLRGPGRDASASAPLAGPPQASRAALPVPPEIEAVSAIGLEITGWRGQTWTATIPDQLGHGETRPTPPVTDTPEAPAGPGTDGPAAPGTFFTLIAALTGLYVAFVAVWLAFDHRKPGRMPR